MIINEFDSYIIGIQFIKIQSLVKNSNLKRQKLMYNKRTSENNGRSFTIINICD